MKSLRGTLLTAATLLFSCFAMAQSAVDAARILDLETGFGARALGMGGAYLGVGDDYSAAYWNPAGLALMKRSEFYLEFSHLRFTNDVTYQTELTSSSTNATKFNAIGLVLPVPTVQGSLVFSLGYQKVKDFDYISQFRGISDADNGLSLPVDTTGQLYDFFGEDVQRGESITDEGGMNQYNLSGAIDISPNISFGMALNYWAGKSEYRLEFSQDDVQNNFTDFPADFDRYLETRSITADYSSFNAVLSGMYRLGRLARLGVTYATPMKFNINETYFQNSSLAFDNGDSFEFEPVEGQFEYDVQIPFEVGTGAAVYLGPILASGSVRYRDWSQMKFKSPDALKDENSAIRSTYGETLRWHLGGELSLPLFDTKLRAGYMRIPSPLKDAAPETDKELYTLGAGLLLDRYLKVDFAAVFGKWQQESSDDLAPEVSAEDIFYRKFLLTFSYRF